MLTIGWARSSGSAENLSPLTFLHNLDTEVAYKGGAPGEVAGVMQINARIPAAAHSGSVPVVLDRRKCVVAGFSHGCGAGWIPEIACAAVYTSCSA
jgi:hypothetical protein